MLDVGMLDIGVCAAVILIVLIAVIRGYRRGFLRTALVMISLVLPIVLVSLIQPYVAQTLRQYTPLERIIETTIRINMDGSLQDVIASGAGENSAPAANTPAASQLTSLVLTEEQQQQWLELCGIPNLLRQKLLNSAGQAADLFSRSVSGYVASVIMNVLSFLLTFLLAFLIIRFLFVSLDLIERIPILHGVNKTLGAFLGLVEGFVVLWLLSLLITVFLPSSWGTQVMSSINQNPVLSFLYNNYLPLGHLLVR